MTRKLHITLTKEEFEKLNELKKYFTKMLDKYDLNQVRLSYSWIIGSAINQAYLMFLEDKKK